MEKKEIYAKWHEQIRNLHVSRHYVRYNNPDADMIEVLAETYNSDDLYDLLIGHMHMDLQNDWVFEVGVLEEDRWRIIAKEIEDTGCPFGHIILALDMYLDGMFDDTGMDSIGRMEDYESEVETC